VAVIDVVPRTRSERLSRIANVTIAVLALIILSPLMLRHRFIPREGGATR
jgi:hypothetical protein